MIKKNKIEDVTAKKTAAEIEMDIISLKEKIKNHIASAKRSEICEKLGINQNNISNFIHGHLEYSPQKLIEMGKILGL